MTSTIVRAVPGHETEVGMGVLASTPPHYVVAWGEYAAEGEADGEIRILTVMNEDGEDITEKTARMIAQFVDGAVEGGLLR